MIGKARGEGRVSRPPAFDYLAGSFVYLNLQSKRHSHPFYLLGSWELGVGG